MVSKFFHRDPREIPFLHQQVNTVLQLTIHSSQNLTVRDDDDFGFMIVQFLYKQMQHAESLLTIVPRRDAGLIARTMIDGLLQLLWITHDPEDRARRWRSFAIIHDWRLIQGRLTAGIPVTDTEITRNAEALKLFGHSHRLRKQKPNSSDPFHRKWYGGVTLSDMADVVGRDLYDGPYADLSDWEHWGVSGIGESISRKDNHVVIEPDSQRVMGQCLLVAFQCLHQTLEIVDAHLSLKLTPGLKGMVKHLVETLGSFEAA